MGLALEYLGSIGAFTVPALIMDLAIPLILHLLDLTSLTPLRNSNSGGRLLLGSH